MEQQPSKRQRTQQHPGAAPGEGAGEDPSRIWLPDVVHHVARFLSSNELACTLRLVSKATAAQFRGPLHTTVQLSLPVPHHAFARRWGSPGATRSLNLWQRVQLPCLTARSGSIANLEVLLARDDALNPLNFAVLEAVAGAGQLEVCRWLRQQGCPLAKYVVEAAAESGQTEVCAWLLAEGCPRSEDAMQLAARGGHRAVCECLLASGYPGVLGAALEAAHRGHADLMDWLLARTAPHWWDVPPGLLVSAAAGCDLPTLRRLHHDYYIGTWGTELSNAYRERTVAAAAGSPTADWRDKVEWLEGRGSPRARRSCWEAAHRFDSRERLEWLQRRGYPLTADAIVSAAHLGNVETLEFLLEQGVQLGAEEARQIRFVAQEGQLASLKVLHAHSYDHIMDHTTVAEAAGDGHLAIVAWLVEVLGAPVALSEDVFWRAADRGCAKLLAWLHEHGCPWDASTVAAAAGGGSVEQVEWLVERGCPMGDDGEPYWRAMANFDLAMMHCLRRLGCPMGASGDMEAAFIKAVHHAYDNRAPWRRKQLLLILTWLEAGAPCESPTAA